MPYSSGPRGHTPPPPWSELFIGWDPTPKPYTCTCIFMIRVNRQIKCPRSWGPGSSPSPTRSFFENYTYLWNHLSILTKLCPNVPWVILFQNYVRHVWGPRGGLKWLVILIFKNLLLVNQQCQKIDTWHITLINLENRNPVIAYNHVISNRQLITTHA
jgi:hypothetical protein